MSDIIFNAQNEVIDLKNKNKADFKSLAKDNKLSEKFILENANFLNWNIISENQVFSMGMVLLYSINRHIKWAKMLKNTHLDVDTLLVAKYKGNWYNLLKKEKKQCFRRFCKAKLLSSKYASVAGNVWGYNTFRRFYTRVSLFVKFSTN